MLLVYQLLDSVEVLLSRVRLPRLESLGDELLSRRTLFVLFLLVLLALSQVFTVLLRGSKIHLLLQLLFSIAPP